MGFWYFSQAKKPEETAANLQKKIQSKIPKLPNIPKNIKIPSNISLNSVSDFVQQLLKNLNQTGQFTPPPSGPPRPMKFPYTFSAKIAQFPYKHYYQNNWIFRWYPIGIAVCVPLFWFFSRIANSKQNKATWKAIRLKEKEEARHKFDYK